MLDCTQLLEVLKKVALNTMEASQPADYVFGVVTQKTPLKIKVEQKMELSKAQLVLCERVTPLEKDDEVVLMKKKGGQQYLVIDRKVNAT